MVYLSTIVLAGSILNILDILLIGSTKKPQTMSFIVAAQVLVLDTVSATVGGISLGTSVVGGGWVLGMHLCIATSFIGSLMGFVRTSSLSVMSLDGMASCLFLVQLHTLKGEKGCLCFADTVVVSGCNCLNFTSTWNFRLLWLQVGAAHVLV